MLTFFVGSYTEYPVPGFGGVGHGIYTVQLNMQTGVLKVIHTENARNPSYLTLSNNQKYLYCNTELDKKDNPKVRAYKIKDDYSLEFLNEQPISGGYPCHINEHNSNLLIACYATGNVLQFPLNSSGELLPCRKNYYHNGSSLNAKRQEAPHAHQVSVHPNTKDIFVCHLGIDTVKAYQLENNQLTPHEKKDFSVSKGGGPRHLIFNKNGNLAYILNELTGDVSVAKKEKDRFQEIITYRALPKGYKGLPSGSAIRLHPNGKFLYAANRIVDTITIFNVKNDTLELVGYEYTKGTELREFNISPDGKWLIACHQNSHDTVVYDIKNDGKLQEKYRTKEILSPVCIVFPKNLNN